MIELSEPLDAVPAAEIRGGSALRGGGRGVMKQIHMLLRAMSC